MESELCMKLKIQFYVIDYLKYIFAIGIIAIHTEVLPVLGKYEYWVEKCFARVGVPFFFIVSGFMLGIKLSEVGDNDLNAEKNIMVSYTKRLIVPLIIFEAVNIFISTVNYALFETSQKWFKFIISNIRNIIFYPEGALWYVQASIVGIWIVYCFKKYNKSKWLLPIGICLYIFALLCNNYYFVIENVAFAKIVDLYLYVSKSARNGLFYGFLFLWLGICTYKFWQKIQAYEKIKVKMALLGAMVVTYSMYVCRRGILIA